MDGLRHDFKMLIKPLLGSLVIIGSYHQNTVNSGFFRFLGKIDRCLCTVGSCSCNNRDSSGRLLHTETDYLQMLLMGQRGSLACSPAYNDGIRAARNLGLDMLSELLVIDTSVLMKRGDNRYACSCKNCHMLLLVYALYCVSYVAAPSGPPDESYHEYNAAGYGRNGN